MSLSRPSRRRILVGGVATAVILAAGAVTLPALAEDAGSISGHLTDGGAPVPGATVTVFDTSFGFMASTNADATGGFTFANIAPGGYKIQFTPAFSFRQWASQKPDFGTADVITVSAGATTIVEEQLLPHGAIVGHVTNPDGTPAVFAQVRAVSSTGGSGNTSTDLNGNYRLPYLLPGQYVVSFNRDFQSPTQYAHGNIAQSEADLFTVTAGTETTVDEQLLAGGVLTGRLTTADGGPLPPFVSVTATNVDTPEVRGFSLVGPDGRYSINVFPGEYTLSFASQIGVQWATGHSSAAEADHFTVVASATTTHDEALRPLGTLLITAVERGTGAPVNSFCVTHATGGACTETGTAAISLLEGRYELSFGGNGGNYLFGNTVAQITSGVTTPFVLELTPGAAVTTTIVDKESGVLVEGACLEVVEVTSPTSLGGENGPPFCSDSSGSVTQTLITAGTYVAFVWANDGVHGHQWVGEGGGTGQFEKARTFTVAAGQELTLPQIRLDLAGGDITGTVTDEVTGAPPPFAWITLSSFNAGTGPGSGSAFTDSDGHYTLSGLGPYQWTLLFSAPGYAPEWSGDSPTRAKARTVKVQKNATVTHNVAVGLGTTVSGTVTGPTGTPLEFGRIAFLNADSADEIGVDDFSGGFYTAQVKGPQRVKIRYEIDVAGQFTAGLVGGATFAEATTFRITPSGSVTIDLSGLG